MCTDSAEDQDQFAPSGTLGGCIKKGNPDGFMEIGGLDYKATSTEVECGEGYKSWKADVKWIGNKK